MPIWAYSTSMGELKSMTTEFQTEDRVVAAFRTISRLAFGLPNIGDAHASRVDSGCHPCPGRCA